MLLVHPTYKPGWEVPGGFVERGESPADACRREIAEELGLDRRPRRLLSVDWLTEEDTAPDDHDGKLLFLFDCGPPGDDEHRFVLGADELDRWVGVGLDDLATHLRPRLARRVRSTVGGPAGAYLERGVVPDGFAPA